MRKYARMYELENYMAKGAGNFRGMLGKKSMAFKDFVDELEKIEQKYNNLSPENIWTVNGQQIVKQFNTFWAVSILFLTNECLLNSLDAEKVDILYENYDKEKALMIFDKIGFKQSLMEADVYREYLLQEDGEMDEQQFSNHIDIELKKYLTQRGLYREDLMQEEDEAVQEESEADQKYNNGNYIDLE